MTNDEERNLAKRLIITSILATDMVIIYNYFIRANIINYWQNFRKEQNVQNNLNKEKRMN